MKKQIYPKIVIEDLVRAGADSRSDSATSRGSGGFGSTDAPAATATPDAATATTATTAAETKVRIKE
jgi:hypothetical protein